MDSKLMRLAALGCFGVIALIAAIVIGVNSKSPASDKQQIPVQNEPVVNSNANADGQVGNDLKGFLRDNTFFDPEKNPVLEAAMDTSKSLTLLATSVEKDLRIQILDITGALVSGESFVIRITDANGKSIDYKDLDKDGIVYAGSLSAGEYEMELMPISGYKPPKSSTTVRVKDKVEYVAIPDISILIKTEDEIDAALEDTGVKDALDDADGTEVVKLQVGGTKRKAGIDVSKYQEEIDWEKVAQSGVEFVIIRAGYRGSVYGSIVEDPRFKENIKGAKAAGLEVGVYFFTQAINEAEAVEEASAVMTLVGDYKLELPIYIDTEGAGGNGRADGLDPDTRTLVCDAFCRTVENGGYRSGVYASRYWLNNNIHTDKLKDYEIWLAEYREIPLYTGSYTMWQYTSKGHIDGINGNVDLDVYYY
ncbi:MAG: glycoside hydrolase family 25 protein [Lachnospiraceae bacterium]|nr:glycoside hydrolase family 25 protein [Lachnospiraceae bacterium]